MKSSGIKGGSAKTDSARANELKQGHGEEIIFENENKKRYEFVGANLLKSIVFRTNSFGIGCL